MLAEQNSASHIDIKDQSKKIRNNRDLESPNSLESVKSGLGALLLGGLAGVSLPACLSLPDSDTSPTAVELASYRIQRELDNENSKKFEDLREQIEKEVQSLIVKKFPDLFYQEQGRMVGELATALEARSSIEKGADQSWQLLLGEWRSRSSDMIQSMLNPLVRIKGNTTVGSGVIIFSQQDPSIVDKESLILTNWHVVRDILNDGGIGRESAAIQIEAQPIPVELFENSEFLNNEAAYIVSYDVDLDLALLSMKDIRSYPVAKLGSAEQVVTLRAFDPVFAVGCPLENEPIPTFGIVCDPTSGIEGHQYLMVSAPTYIGNSGGAIFSGYEDGFRMVGLLTKIFTHGIVRPEVVSHMGLATSMVEGQRFLAAAGYRVGADGALVKMDTNHLTLVK